MGNRKTAVYLFILFLVFAGSYSLPVYGQETTDSKLSEMSLEDLLNVDVTTASKSEEKQSDAPGIISVLGKDDLKRFGGTTLKDILERVPGLIGSSVYMTDRQMISPRGDQVQASSAHVLLLLNGRPVRESLEGGIKGEFLMTFPTNVIERIEVIKGPGSVLYGSNAFSAVINVITESANETGFDISGLVGNGGAYGTQGKLKVNAGDFGLVAAGRLFKKAEWETNYTVKVANAPDYTFPVNMPDEGPGAFVKANYKNFSVTGSYNKWKNYFIIPDYIPAYNAYGDAEWEKFFTNVGYDVAVTDSWNTSVNVTYTKSKFEVANFPSVKRDSYDLVAEVTNFITLSDKSKLIVGALYNKVDGGETFYGVPGLAIPISDANRTGYGLYAQVDYQILENLKGIGGIQLNKYEEVDMGFVPRVGLIWYPAPRYNVKVLYSTAFRAPSINEFDLKHPNLLGDPKLKSEKVGTIDVSLSYQGEQTQFAFNFFRSNMTDVIYQNRAVVPAKYSNGGEVTSTGFEFEGKYYVNKNLYLVGSLLYHNTEDNNGNKDITPISSFGTKAGVSYDWNEAATLSLFDIYQGVLSSFFENTPNKNPGAYNILYLYGNLNLNKAFNFKMKQEFSLFIQVDNLLDEEVWVPAWGLSPGQSIPFNQGRSFYFGLNLSI